MCVGVKGENFSGVLCTNSAYGFRSGGIRAQIEKSTYIENTGDREYAFACVQLNIFQYIKNNVRKKVRQKFVTSAMPSKFHIHTLCDFSPTVRFERLFFPRDW